MLLAILAALVVIGFFWAAFRKPKLIPGHAQSLGEMAILAVRDQILRPSLGKKGDSYLPFLVSLFFFIYIMNVMELIPVLQFPVTSRIGFVAIGCILIWSAAQVITAVKVKMLYVEPEQPVAGRGR